MKIDVGGISGAGVGAGTSKEIVAELMSFVEDAAKAAGSTRAVNPGHRVPFHWPPHPVSYSYHVLASDWRGEAKVAIHGESFDVQIAKTPNGVFGRIGAIWLEARGTTQAEMLENLKKAAEPLFARQFAISRTLGLPSRFTGHARHLPAPALVKLLYCEDRDVANEAQTAIELHASAGVFGPALVQVLTDEKHPYRRSAQWCVLDLFEDIKSFCKTPEEEKAAVAAMRELLWSAEDDYARTVYKAGVVLGGHIPDRLGGPVLIECLRAPSKIGRRSAVHGLFHVVEWHPESRVSVVKALEQLASNDPEPLLREYASLMARDVRSGQTEHIDEPSFGDEG